MILSYHMVFWHSLRLVHCCDNTPSHIGALAFETHKRDFRGAPQHVVVVAVRLGVILSRIAREIVHDENGECGNVLEATGWAQRVINSSSSVLVGVNRWQEFQLLSGC